MVAATMLVAKNNSPAVRQAFQDASSEAERSEREDFRLVVAGLDRGVVRGGKQDSRLQIDNPHGSSLAAVVQGFCSACEIVRRDLQRKCFVEALVPGEAVDLRQGFPVDGPPDVAPTLG